LTGLRRNELPQLLFSDLNFEERYFTVRAEINKSRRTYCLPMSDFLFDLFKRRYEEREHAEYVFGGYRGDGRYYGCERTLKKLRQQVGCDFLIHDLRRCFLTL